MSKNIEWDEVLGMSYVDGAKPDEFFLGLIEREKRGEISLDEIDELLVEHYTK